MTVSRKVFRSTAAALVVLSLAVVGGCSPGASASPAPSMDAAGAPLPQLIDTDVAPDDLVAIAFLLASPEVDIKAITVSGTRSASRTRRPVPARWCSPSSSTPTRT